MFPGLVAGLSLLLGGPPASNVIGATWRPGLKTKASIDVLELPEAEFEGWPR